MCCVWCSLYICKDVSMHENVLYIYMVFVEARIPQSDTNEFLAEHWIGEWCAESRGGVGQLK